MKFVLVVGAAIGKTRKGVLAGSIGTILKARGLRVTSVKINPHLNIDSRTFSPHEHGEVFVLDDGGEVDLDLGNYERFLDVTLHRDNNITMGKVYLDVISRERSLSRKNLIPHITDSMHDWIIAASKMPVDDSGLEPDVCIIELGGMLGDSESMSYLEAFGRIKVRSDDFCFVLVSLVPQIVGQSSKPIHKLAKKFREGGLAPDLIICGCTEKMESGTVFYPISDKQIISVPEDSSIYKIPILLEEQNVVGFLSEKLKLEFPVSKPDGILEQWKKLAYKETNLQSEVVICLVGNAEHEDAFTSVDQALGHAAMACDNRLVLKYVKATSLEDETRRENPVRYHAAWQVLCSADGVLIPGGFGSRGLEGMILVARRARESKKPFLGIGHGLHCAVIEYSRNVLGLSCANTLEVDQNTPHPVIISTSGGQSSEQKCGTAKLGKRRMMFVRKSTLKKLYGDVDYIDERHKHRYEVNSDYVPILENSGLQFVGKDENEEKVEVLELKDHPYYVAVQYHPEYLSRPLKPSAPFLGLILAAKGRLEAHLNGVRRLSLEH